jgi:hypothetical protein
VNRIHESDILLFRSTYGQIQLVEKNVFRGIQREKSHRNWYSDNNLKNLKMVMKKQQQGNNNNRETRWGKPILATGERNRREGEWMNDNKGELTDWDWVRCQHSTKCHIIG